MLPAKREKMTALEGQLDDRVKVYAAVLPKHITPERMVRSALVAVQRNPKLLDCTPESMFVSIMRAAMLGLDLTGANEAYLVPFRNTRVSPAVLEAQLIPDYRGLEKLARQSGEIVSIEPTAVYEGETFEMRKGTVGRGIHHEIRPDIDRSDEKIVGVYAIAFYRNNAGPPQYEFMSRAEIEKIRNMSRAPNSLMWSQSWGQGGCKTVVKRLCKNLPQSPQMQQAIALEDAAEADTAGIALPGLDDWQLAKPDTQKQIDEPAGDGAAQPEEEPAPHGKTGSAPSPPSGAKLEAGETHFGVVTQIQAKFKPDGTTLKWKKMAGGRFEKSFQVELEAFELPPNTYLKTESNPSSTTKAHRWAVGDRVSFVIGANEEGGADKWKHPVEKGKMLYFCRVEHVRPAMFGDEPAAGEGGAANGPAASESPSPAPSPEPAPVEAPEEAPAVDAKGLQLLEADLLDLTPEAIGFATKEKLLPAGLETGSQALRYLRSRHFGVEPDSKEPFPPSQCEDEQAKQAYYDALMKLKGLDPTPF